jgi:peptidoglycan hydrolase-like protein with peptidoglycan-binding domain
LKLDPKKYSEQVRIAQIRLKEMGYKVEATGYFDDNTLKAVNQFKDKNGLGNTGEWEGVLGPQTWDMLFALGSMAAAGSSIPQKVSDPAEKGNVINSYINTSVLNSMISKYVNYVYTGGGNRYIIRSGSY